MAIEVEDKPKRRPRGFFGPWVLLTLAFLLGLGWAAVVLYSGRAIVAPAWLTKKIEARATEALGGPGQLQLGEIVAQMGEGYIPRIVMRDIQLRDNTQSEIARIPELRARFSLESLFKGELGLTQMTVVGGEMTLRRDRFGRFDLAFGSDTAVVPAGGSLPDIMALIDGVFKRPSLVSLNEVTGEALRLTFQDALSGRVWRAEGGVVRLRQEADRRNLSMSFSLAGGAGAAPAAVRITLSAPKGPGPLDISADFSNVTAADLAAQIPALAWLTAAEAPLSANLRMRIAADGALETFQGTLEIGSGAIRPKGAARPIPFDGAKASIVFDPEKGRIAFSDITAITPEARFQASGQALLGQIDPASGIPKQILLQLSLSEIELDPVGELAEPARFDTGALDLRLTIDPFRIEIGQLVLVGGDRHFRATGDFSAEPEGWAATVDLNLDQIEHDRLAALWPLRIAPKVRDWLVRNVTEGLLHDVRAAIRILPGTEARVALGYEFRDGTVRFLPTLPPIVGGAGHATIADTRYTMVLTKGEVLAPTGEAIDATGSVLSVQDITVKPAPAEIRLETESTIPAALALLDEKPFEFLSKAGRETDLADGHARVSAVIRLPLERGVKPDQIDFSISGHLTEVMADSLVPGRVLEADTLILNATNENMSIGGPVRIGSARFDATWSQPLGADASQSGSRVEGTVMLDQGFLDEFAIALPQGMLSGEGAGQIEMTLKKDTPPEFQLVSDLNRLALRIPALGWSKGRNTTGRLEVKGALAQPARIDRIALTAPGLEAVGRINLTPQGGFAAAKFERVRAGRWLDAQVELTSRGAGRSPAVAVTGGTFDLRATRIAGSGAGGGGPLTLALDRVIVSEGIEFRNFRANLTTRGGLNGRFSANLAGSAPVVGALAPLEGGTAVRLQSNDAGAVLRASGLLESARQGVFDLTLVPLPGEGRYDGRLRITGLRLRGAPALADLLGAISVVGLIEQLDGQGVVFNEVTGEFTLEPRGVTLRRGSGVGASLGVSMAGVYDLRTKVMDMQGTISPIYILNGIGQIFTRRGEGLFGFNYRMQGSASNPQIQVNPLSILTPGMFREIFRAPPPQLPQ